LPLCRMVSAFLGRWCGVSRPIALHRTSLYDHPFYRNRRDAQSCDNLGR
jgi:hypothetical protein